MKAAGVLYRVGNTVLLLLRGPDGDCPGTWGLPGGKVEEGETPLQGACRESSEEIGVLPDAASLSVIHDDGLFTTYETRPQSQFTPRLNEEHLRFVWASLDNLPKPVHPGLFPLLEKLRMTTAQDTTSQRVPDGNGWFEVKANPISRVGVFPYSGRQLGLDGPDADRIFQVYRPAEELAHPECLNSFKLIPWIDNHTMLGPNMQRLTDAAVPAEAKGVQGVIGEDVFFKDGTLYGNIKAFSNILADLIASGKRELSAGYRCVYDMVSGIFEGQHYDAVQRQIRGNHLALVTEGRMGPQVAVLDAFTFTFDSKDITMADPAKKDDDKSGGGAAGMTLEQCITAVSEMAPQVAKLTAALAAMGKPAAEPVIDGDGATPGATPGAEPAEDLKPAVQAMDAQVKTLQATVKSLTENATRNVMADIAKRDVLVARLTPHTGTFDHAEKTLAEVAVYGCEKLGIKVAADAALPALEGYLTAVPGKTPAARVSTGQDAALSGSGMVQDFINGK